MRNSIQVCLPAIASLAVLAPGSAQATIADGAITTLQKELAQAGRARTKTRRRLALKRVVRGAESLLAKSPDAANRWRVLDIVLRSQKRLLVLEPKASGRRALLATCAKLAKAPDAYADVRLEADLLLSERKLSLENADVKVRAKALAELVARYRDTPGEAKSLMMASQIAPKLEAFELEMQILRAMQERFADHHEVIEFRRKSLAAGRIEALFRSSFRRADGTELSFPVDRLGHQCLLVFWSKRTPDIGNVLRKIDAHRTAHPGRFDFYSLNVDGLADAGAVTLRELQLPWEPLQLPGGLTSQTFRTYGRRHPVSILVNAYGYTLLTPTNNYARGHRGTPVDPFRIDPVRLTDPRYLTQLQSLFAGDFLVATIGAPTTGPLQAVCGAVDACFVPAPLRYRLSRDAAFANYEKAVQLCRDAVTKHADDAELWRVRHRMILGLIGMWKSTGRTSHLDAAVRVARAAKDEASVVARFCLAIAALRSSARGGVEILKDFVTADTAAPGPQLAAAAILALYANSSELHAKYRAEVLARHTEEPALWPVVTFLRDRFHTLDLLKVKLNRPERRIRNRYGDRVGPRGHMINHLLEPRSDRFPALTFRTLDGKDMQLPQDTAGKLTILAFVEPPPGAEDDFPVRLDRKGRPTKGDPLRAVMGYAIERAGLHVHKEVRVVAAFLTDDAERVRSLMKKNEWACEAVLVPGGLKSRAVRQLGVLSADRIPNVYLLRRDGTVAWHASGFFLKSDFGYPFATRLALKVHIEVCDLELGYKALAAGRFAEAQRILAGPFELERDERYRWRAPRFHARALASAGLKQFDVALADIDASIVAHRKEFDHGDKPSATLMSLRRARGLILARLGRSADSQAALEAAQAKPTKYPETVYDAFHQRLAPLGAKLLGSGR